jgi:hypothetical protein
LIFSLKFAENNWQRRQQTASAENIKENVWHHRSAKHETKCLAKSQFFGFSLDSLSLYTPNLDFSLKFAENKTECLATPPTNSLS